MAQRIRTATKFIEKDDSVQLNAHQITFLNYGNAQVLINTHLIVEPAQVISGVSRPGVFDLPEIQGLPDETTFDIRFGTGDNPSLTIVYRKIE